MPLNEKDRIEKQVLRYLHFHERSAVPLAGDTEAALRFEVADTEALVGALSDMFSRNLFRILPPPASARETVERAGFAGEGPAEPGLRFRKRLEESLRAGVNAMITSEGKRRYSELRTATTAIRQEDWQKAHDPSEPGAWVRADDEG